MLGKMSSGRSFVDCRLSFGNLVAYGKAKEVVAVSIECSVVLLHAGLLVSGHTGLLRIGNGYLQEIKCLIVLREDI